MWELPESSAGDAWLRSILMLVLALGLLGGAVLGGVGIPDWSALLGSTPNVIGAAGAGFAAIYGLVGMVHDFGEGEPDETGDRIYNGALDNGVAMAQALSVAEAFSALPERSRRSIMVLFVAAEEQGLLGSKFYTEHPTIPPGKIAADVNFELGNVWGRTKDVTIFGKGKSTLEDILAELGRRKKQQFLVGFAAESENVRENARHKLKLKQLDLIVANDISERESGFEVDMNRVLLIDREGNEEQLELLTKTQVAGKVWDRIEKLSCNLVDSVRENPAPQS